MFSGACMGPFYCAVDLIVACSCDPSEYGAVSSYSWLRVFVCDGTKVRAIRSPLVRCSLNGAPVDLFADRIRLISRT